MVYIELKKLLNINTGKFEIIKFVHWEVINFGRTKNTSSESCHKSPSNCRSGGSFSILIPELFLLGISNNGSEILSIGVTNKTKNSHLSLYDTRFFKSPLKSRFYNIRKMKKNLHCMKYRNLT